MLLRFSRLVALDDIDDVKLPGRVANGISVRDLIHHVVEIVDGVDDFPDVRFLRLGHSRHLKRMGLFPVTIAVRIPVDPADIVVTVVGVIAPDVSIRHTLISIPGSPKIEQHDADIHPSVTSGNHPCSEAVEIGLIKLVQVKLRQTISRAARTCPRVGQRRGSLIPRSTAGKSWGRRKSGVGLRRFRNPETNKIMIVGLKKPEVTRVVEGARLAILQVGPRV